MLEKYFICLDKDTTDSFDKATGGGAGAAIGNVIGGPALEVVEKTIRDPLGTLKNPFTGAAEEQDQRFQDALDQAKTLKTTANTTQDSTSGTIGTSAGTSQTKFDPKGGREASLERLADQNLSQQQKLVAQQEASIKGLGGIQQQGRDVLGDIAGGQAFALSPEEQQRIDAQRQANIDVSSGAINDLLNQRLAETSADAARRGVRGQAFSQLQTGAIGEAARNLGTQTTAANQIAANQALALPGQRVGVQAGVVGGLANIQNDLIQRGVENRGLLQSPAALLREREERLASGKTSTIGTTNQTNTTSGTSNTVGTGQGVVELLAQRAALPGAKAAGLSGLLDLGSLGVKAVGAWGGGG